VSGTWTLGRLGGSPVSWPRTRLSHALDGVTHCPMDDGAAEVIALSYRGRPDVDLWVPLNGCGGISNGYIMAGREG
jgi:hypothetical protein